MGEAAITTAAATPDPLASRESILASHGTLRLFQTATHADPQTHREKVVPKVTSKAGKASSKHRDKPSRDHHCSVEEWGAESQRPGWEGTQQLRRGHIGGVFLGGVMVVVDKEGKTRPLWPTKLLSSLFLKGRGSLKPIPSLSAKETALKLN